MDRKSLDQAATLAGIAANYINAHGKSQAISAQTKQQLLAAMGRTSVPPDSQTEKAPLPPVKIFTFGSAMQLPMAGSGDYHWQLQTEKGDLHQGRISAKKTLTLPASLPQGYHRLVLEQGLQQWQCSVIVAPKRCYEPDALLAGKKLWGACVQLYTLRSDHNWGIGDFGDLNQMLEQVAERGGAFIGLNPIHALYPANPHSASPYSPSSRRWLNVIYIDVNRVDEFQHSEAAQTWWHQPEIQGALAKARASEWVDYPQVMQLKLTALRLAFPLFTARKTKDARVQAFHRFVEQGGSSLHQQAAFDALHAHLSKNDPMMWGWPVWPEKYRDGHSSAVADFSREHADEVNFYLWLQWLAASQFEDCFRASQTRKMPLGLYRDLAVGVAEGGAETWCDRELYCLKASVGAPPDILGPLGQNWGLPPMDPHVMAARAYQPFIDLLRANMTSCGALRIDHVMALLRLWWIPYGQTADQGAYVKYPVDDLLAILALESQRHRCMVIGEDLGTVPVEIVGKLRDSGVYSYKVLYFEHDSENTFRAPQSYPVQAMATITTHDLPTLRGYWQSDDLTLGNKLGLYPDQQILKQLYLDRERAKQGLLEGLHHYDCVPTKVGHKASLLSMSPVLNRGLQRYVADSASALLGLQPEDWLDMATPVNIPGTSDEYPNWRRKLTATLEEMFADEQVNRLLKDLDKRRKNVSAG
ncbi:4-alpha-glucanotransferase [Yersinia enterocolitica]|uniref:4-alpha-glucanotransferase n=1 Tax=Yersinia enterocolitica serotype O:8 / biotype 1B (strain NCTC 13174 / 8081) TaxID=393305 RepID=A1JSF5_YERE8|nr:4-alpha-glucanotransferase [Yersinia enterocolitica]AJJ23346.1 4-alpha-glucanotransferase [Yersinia enterocolitica]CAL14012.1 4-alpha-glucanotransferase [Yersinia enterocolitica subsp. enterocolitica 8081]HDL8279844.1 4-alpha-glucanotransferase [Yersinia enterocolitica]HDM8288668.1 4-alpha-glucanotransferase [Yersinia enterocolitica]HDM8292941.1 4-alpha-glucanotransferase [Yersinia enterocolitica]